MKHYLKLVIITLISFYSAYTLIPTINLGNDPQNILTVIGGLLLISLIINPLFSIILLPINLITHGLVSLLLNIALIFVLLRILPGFDIRPYNFPGADISGFVIPAVKLTQTTAIIAVATIITLVQRVLHVVFE